MIENDIENIIPFFFLGLIFVMTGGPELSVTYCKNIFRLFFFSRCAMSFCHYFHIQVFLYSTSKCCDVMLLISNTTH